MDFDKLNIVIIDTQTNDKILEDEFAEASSIKLIYNGTDDRLQLLMTSYLKFSILVNDGSEGKFEHLLTTNELRYKVVVEVLDENDIVLYNLWTGFLLPDQFSEPYITGPYFVNFIATDGLGILKGKLYGPVSLGTESITSVITACLLKSGVLLGALHIAPAIENAVEDVRVDQLRVDNNAYYDAKNQKFDNCYDILQRILLVLGSKLFQYNSEWYIVGINRFEEQNITFQNFFGIGGLYIDTTVFNRDLQPIRFLDQSTNVKILQSYKTVSFNWERNLPDIILPEDIVYQPIEEGAIWSDSNFLLKYWHSNFNDAGASNPITLGTKDGSPASWNDGIWVMNPGYVTIKLVVNNAIIDNNYMSLKKAIFIDEPQKIHLSISGVVLFDYDISGKDFSNCILYEIYFNGNVIISNRTSFQNYLLYDFKLDYNNKNLKFELEIDEIELYNFGSFDIRFYAFKNDTGEVDPTDLILHEFSITTNNESNIKQTLTRDDNLSLINEIDTFHGSSLTDITNKKIEISTSVPFVNYIIDYPEVLEQIPAYNYTIYDVTNNGITFTHHRIEFTYEDWLRLKDNINIIYLKKGGVGALVKPTFYQLLDTIPGSNYPFIDWIPEIKASIFDQTTVQSSTPELIESGDEIWLWKAGYQETLLDRHYLMKYWKLYGGNEAYPLLKILAMLYHNQVDSKKYILSGRALGVYGPLAYIDFKYKTDKVFIPIALNIDLVNGETQITMIEPTNNAVTNYG